MGVYKASVVTQGGQNLIARAIAENKAIIFTSAKTSSYAYPLGTNITALTGLQDIEQSVIPFDSKVINQNVAQVSVRFDNDGVTQPYLINTIGLYAKIEEEAEILFSVTQANTPDEMPVQSDVSPSAFIYNIQSTVQNASQITVTVNPAGTATVQDILALRNPEFDDSGEVEGITGFPQFLEKVKSKMNIFQFYRDFKAGMKFVLHAGQIVNNCTSERTDLPLAAKQGKELMDLYTQLYVNIGNIRYADYATDDVAYQRKPLEFLKTKWEDLNANSIYLIKLQCGSVYLALVQTYSTHANGSVTIVSYNYGNPLYAQLINGTWTENSLITNNDLDDHFAPIQINGNNGETFSGALKNKLYNSVAFVAFTVGDSTIPDNPFSFISGYAIVFHSGLITYNNVFMLIGISSSNPPVIEAKYLDLR